MCSFVIEFNRCTAGRRLTVLSTPAEAMQLRLELEHARRNRDVEICALTSASLEALQRTHSRYFVGTEVADPYSDSAVTAS